MNILIIILDNRILDTGMHFIGLSNCRLSKIGQRPSLQWDLILL